MLKVSVITPWHNCPELIPAYQEAVSLADEVIIIDNASDEPTAKTLEGLGVYVRNPANLKYSKANNQGLQIASGDFVVFLNSDVQGNPQWIEMLKQLAQPGYLYGPSMGRNYVDEQMIIYLEGWCIGGFKDEIRKIGGWNEDIFPGLYYEDNEFCWRATQNGMALRQVDLPLRHLSNYTSKRTPGAYDHSQQNRAIFFEMVRNARNVQR